jgi:hypothetical protein
LLEIATYFNNRRILARNRNLFQQQTHSCSEDKANDKVDYTPPITQTSFDESEVMKSLPFPSKARSAGRKHLEGQFALFALLITLMAAVVDVEGSTGIPVAGLTLILLRR